jgi:hypothetical protein
MLLKNHFYRARANEPNQEQEEQQQTSALSQPTTISIIVDAATLIPHILCAQMCLLMSVCSEAKKAELLR